MLGQAAGKLLGYALCAFEIAPGHANEARIIALWVQLADHTLTLLQQRTQFWVGALLVDDRRQGSKLMTPSRCATLGSVGSFGDSIRLRSKSFIPAVHRSVGKSPELRIAG